MLNHGHPASLYCKKTVLKQHQELEKARKLENSGYKIPDSSQPHDGTAPPPPGARHVRSGAGLGGRPPGSPQSSLLSRLCLTAAGLDADNHPTGWKRLPAMPPSVRSGRGQPGGARQSPHPRADRTAPPASPATLPGGLRSGPSAGRQRADPPEQLHSPKPGGGAGGRQCPPAPGSSSPSEPGHAGQPAPRSELQEPEDHDEPEPRSGFPRSGAPTLPSSNPLPPPHQVCPPSRWGARPYLGQAAGEAQPSGAEGCPAGGDGRLR
ncbi:uncharacterized protein LOC120751033 [Hirundo rustica]|uniref:uncharacterized protein LOC120751033 n=1 Tax=Hirundo rustica TaxID=43150 RepID=UPI001A948932|nr:uncharacterized protein LOC120751033 [Hirundo rustica]